jgi:uncharacterized membrane protein YhhN
MALQPVHFLILCALSVVGLLVGEYRDEARIRWVFKPLASASFIGVGLTAGALGTTYGQIVLVGLVLCMAGDVLLIPRRDSTFLLGLGSFLLGHLAFAVAFTRYGLDMSTMLMGLGLAAVVGIPVMAFVIMPRVPKEMKIPVAAYTVVISGMVATAAGGWGQGLSVLVPLGAIAFFFSDLSVALDAFVKRSFVNRVWGLPLYFGSVCAVAISVSEIWNPLLQHAG